MQLGGVFFPTIYLQSKNIHISGFSLQKCLREIPLNVREGKNKKQMKKAKVNSLTSNKLTTKTIILIPLI